MAELRRLEINIISNADQVTKDVENLNKAFQQTDKTIEKTGQGVGTLNAKARDLSSTFKTLGIGLTATVTAPIALIGKTMLEDVAKVEQFRVQLDTLTGSAKEGARLLNEFQQFAAKTPFQLTGVVDSAKQLLAFGISTKDVLKDLEALGNAASLTGAPLERLTLNFGQVKALGRVTGREIRDFANSGIPVLEELAKILNKSTAEIQGMVEEGQIGFPLLRQAFYNLSAEGGRFQDGLIKQSKTFNGVLSNIRDNFTRVALSLFGLSTNAEDFGSIIEGGVFDTLKTAVEGVLNVLNTLVQFFNELPVSVRTTIVAIAGLAALIGPLLLAFGAIAGTVSFATTALAGFGITVSGLLLPIAGIVAALVGAGLAIKFFYDEWMRLSEEAYLQVNQDLQNQLTALEKNQADRMAIMQNESELIVAEIEKRGANATEAERKNAVERLTEQEQAIKDRLLLDIQEKQAFIQNQKEVAKAINGVYDAQNNRIISQERAFFQGFLQLLLSGFRNAVDILKATGKAFVSVMSNSFKGMVDVARNAVTNIASAFKNLVTGKFEEAGNAFKEAFLGSAIKAIDGVENIGAGIGKVGSELAKDISQNMDAYDKAVKLDELDFSKDIDNINANFVERVEAGKKRIEEAGKETGEAFANGLGKGAGGKKSDEALKEAEKVLKESEQTIQKISDLKKRLNEESFEGIGTDTELQNSLNAVLSDTKINIEDLTSAWNRGYGEVESAIKNLQAEHERNLKKIQDDIDSTTLKLKDLRDSYAKASQEAQSGFERTAAGIVVQAETRKKELEALITKAEAERGGAGDAEAQKRAQEEIDKLKSQLAEQQAILDTQAKEKLATEDELTRARELANANDLERARLLFEEEKLLREEKFKAEEEALTKRLEALEVLKNQEITMAQEKEAKLREYETLITNTLLLNLQTRESAETATINRLIQKYNELAAAKARAGYSAGGATSPEAMALLNQFATGGYTGMGAISKIAGLVHKGEWVAPAWMLKRFGGVFSQLEGIRKRGFSGGGYTTNNYKQPININANVHGKTDFHAVARYMSWKLRHS
jgi:tape measure domain-containing protein